MSIHYENKYGSIEITNGVIADIAGKTASQCYGVVGMVYKSKTANLLRGDSIRKGIIVNIADEAIQLELHIMVEYGVNITAICENIKSTVKYEVEDAVGKKVSSVSVHIDGMRVD